jgi:tetratricopeptide (TPR) repeat protein
MTTFLRFFFLIFFSSFCLESSASAQGQLEFSTRAREAYQKAIALRFDEALVLVGLMKREEPNNYMVFFIENYIESLRVFIGEERADYDRYLKKVEPRLQLIKRADPNSPYYLFTQAQIRLWWALNRFKFNDRLTAFNEFSGAFELLEENQEKFPDFMPNKMSLGVLHTAVGLIPDKYKWSVTILSGLNGTVEQGKKEIEEVVSYAQNNDFIFEQEAVVSYALCMLHLNNQPDAAWSFANDSRLKPTENPLACLTLANIALKSGKNDRAIEILQNRPRGKEFYPLHLLDYMMGLAKLYRGDRDAESYLWTFVMNFKGRHYLKEAYQRLAWSSVIKGDIAAYWQHLEFIRTRGRAEIGGDKNALKEGNAQQLPDPVLLRARLFFDGGYFQKSYDFLQKIDEQKFSAFGFKLEFNYRMGRTLQMLKRPTEALSFFERTLQIGQNTQFYYACGAALQSGLISEQLNNFPKARMAFNTCLRLKPDDYAETLHAKAKAGLARVKDR